MTQHHTAPRAANLLNLDYHAEAKRLGPPVCPIIDVHTHINGSKAAAVYKQVMDAFGIESTWTQTQMASADAVRNVLGERARFIAIPEYMADDRIAAHTTAFIDNIKHWHAEYGAKMVKLWNAPRIIDYMEEAGAHDVAGVDSPWRIRAADTAAELGMGFMTHIADPDTWFATKYADPDRYGTKAQQYEGLERMLERYPVPWIAAHMAGWPEDLAFLDRLLSRHDNLRIDTSATKWQIRELSAHTHEDLRAFFHKWQGRIIFGSDIVTRDIHLEKTDPENTQFGAHLANSKDEAFELYASRYWALRTMFETDHKGPSPIADPDLAMVDPDNFDALSSPTLVGRSLPKDELQTLYRGAAESYWASLPASA